MKKFMFILLLSAPCFGDGPKYHHGNSLLNDEFDNVYLDIRNVLRGDVRISSATITNLTVTSGTGTFALRGKTTGVAAPTGYVGEVVSSYAGATNCANTGLYKDLASISLTAGNWMLYLRGEFILNGATMTRGYMGAGLTTGNVGPNITGLAGDDAFDGNIPTAATNGQMFAPGIQFDVNVSTTVYYKIQCTFSAGTPQARGRILAIRTD